MDSNRTIFKTDEELIYKTANSFLNHPATEENLSQMREWLENILSTVYSSETYNTGFSETGLQEIEKSLGINLPSTLRLIYSYIGKDTDLLIPAPMKMMDLKFVNLNELRIEKDVIVHDYYSGEEWYATDILVYSTTRKGKKAYAGIDLKRDWHLSFYKKWYWQKDCMPLYKDLPVMLTCIAISQMDNVFKTKMKGVTGWKVDENAEKMLGGHFKRFANFEHFGHTLFFNKQQGALGWFRAGSAIPDLLVGSNDKSFVDDLIDKLDFSKAKHDKINGVDVKGK